MVDVLVIIYFLPIFCGLPIFLIAPLFNRIVIKKEEIIRK